MLLISVQEMSEVVLGPCPGPMWRSSCNLYPPKPLRNLGVPAHPVRLLGPAPTATEIREAKRGPRIRNQGVTSRLMQHLVQVLNPPGHTQTRRIAVLCRVDFHSCILGSFVARVRGASNLLSMRFRLNLVTATRSTP